MNLRPLAPLFLALLAGCSQQPPLRGSGDLGVLIERADGSVQILDGTAKTSLARVEGLGDLSHASLVFSRDQRYAYVFGRDGGLTKLDLLAQRIDKRLIQGGNSIGGAISQDGRLVAVSNYEPGGVKVFDSRTLELVAEIPATRLPGQDRNSRVVGLVDAPGQRFVFSLFDSGEIWIADFSQGDTPHLTRFRDIGKQPYDALISPDGRYYMAGLFGEDGMAQLDLWHPERGVRRVLGDYGRGQRKLPVYKMPHTEGWTIASDQAFVPAVGHHGAGARRARLEADRRHRRRRPAGVRHDSTGRPADLGQLRLPGQRQGAGHRQRDPRSDRNPAPWPRRTAHGIQRARRPGLDLGARRRPVAGLGPVPPEAHRQPSGPQPERHLLQPPRPAHRTLGGTMDDLSRRLLARYQKGLPICAEPYRRMAETLGCSEAEVLERLRRLEADGALSRVGPVLRHQRAGASTLAALAVPEERLQRVAERISQYAEVNHNYQREHRYNLWFVLTAGDRAQLDRVLAEIAADTGLQPLDLPMQEAYCIDLAFPLEASR